MTKALIIVILTTAIVLLLGKQKNHIVKQVLNWFPAILFAYVIPALITHSTGWDLSHVYLHTISKDWIIPLAILTVMSALSFSQLKIIGLRPILLFVIGSVVIATLPVLLVLLAGAISPEYHDLFIGQEY